MEKLVLKNIYSIVLIITLACSFSFAKHNLLIIRTEGASFEEAQNGLTYDLEYDFDIKELIVNKSTKTTDISARMSSDNPQVVVLMNNISVSLYRKYQESLPADSKFVPAIALMGILLDDKIDGMKNTYGIEYEIPIVTSAVNLRTVLGANKVKSIGIVHRENFTSFIEENRTYCKNEGINLETVVIGTKRVEADLKKALNKLVDEKNVDAIWVPVDNKLINQSLLMNVWIPFQKKYKKAMIVGVGNLVNPKFHFGTFAVLPDHVALGSQAASVIYDVMDNDWQVEENGAAQPPLSVYTILNYPDNKDYFGIDKDNLMGVDKILE